VLWTTVAVDLLGFGIVVPLLPLYARHLGAGPAAVGLLLAAFSAAQFVGAPLLGRLSDRVGRKPVLVVSLVGTAVGSLLTGVAGSLWLLVVGRVVDGASGGSVAVAQASASDLVAPSQRARVFGLLGAAYGVGFVVGPAIGGLAALGGTRLPFFVAAGIAAVNAVVALRRLPETRHLPAPAAGLQSAPSHSRRRFAGMGGALRAVAVPAGVTVLLVAAFSAFEATFALFGQHRLGFGLADTGAVFAMVGVVAAVVQGGLVHPLSARLGDAGCLRLGLVAEGVGLALLAAVHTRSGLVGPLALVTAGQGLCTPSLNALVVARVPDDDRGSALGAQQGCSSLARVLGPVAGGSAYAVFGTGAAFVGGALVVAVALALSLALYAGARPDGEVVVETSEHRLPLGNNG
jgi:MFS family permease